MDDKTYILHRCTNRWKFSLNGGFKTMEINMEISLNYYETLDKNKKFKIKTTTQHTYLIDFTKMEQINDDTKRNRKIKKEELEKRKIAAIQQTQSEFIAGLKIHQ